MSVPKVLCRAKKADFDDGAQVFSNVADAFGNDDFGSSFAGEMTEFSIDRFPKDGDLNKIGS